MVPKLKHELPPGWVVWVELPCTPEEDMKYILELIKDDTIEDQAFIIQTILGEGNLDSGKLINTKTLSDWLYTNRNEVAKALGHTDEDI